MKEISDSLKIGYDAGNDGASLVIGRTGFDGKIEIINAFSGDDAIQLYSKLIGTPKQNKEEENNNDYYVCVLKSGITLDFDKSCNKVNYKSEQLCAFMYDDGKSSICLGMVPYENIKCILNKTEDNADDFMDRWREKHTQS